VADDAATHRDAATRSTRVSVVELKGVERSAAKSVAGLYDRRERNGAVELDEGYLSLLYGLVGDGPQDYGYPRPTWTREPRCPTEAGTLSEAFA
jgi:hypothetical protein